MNKILIALVLGAYSLSAQSALIDRGGGFIYDDVLDITWTQNANINGVWVSWGNQVAWAASLSLYDSVRDVTWSDWRLPATLQPDASCSSQTNPGGSFPSQGFGSGCTGSELGHLFNVDGISRNSPGPFTNIESYLYWSGTEYAPDTGNAWLIHSTSGLQGNASKDQRAYAWAVRDGDVAAVPVPAAVWLFGSALMGLLGVRRVRR